MKLFLITASITVMMTFAAHAEQHQGVEAPTIVQLGDTTVRTWSGKLGTAHAEQHQGGGGSYGGGHGGGGFHDNHGGGNFHGDVHRDDHHWHGNGGGPWGGCSYPYVFADGMCQEPD